MLFKFERVGKEFAGEWLFRKVTLQANDGEHIGLIGRNGVGKTTLFNLLEGSLAPDAGTVVRSGALKIGRVKQIADLREDESVFAEANSVFSEVRTIEARLQEVEHRISEEGTSDKSAREYEHLRHQFEFAGGYDHEARTEKVLFGLGFSPADLDLACRKLSGGQRSRLLLAKTLLKPASLLLLDEPTNHLDLSGILWLIDFLKAFAGAVLVVSHDRYFLDEVTDRTWEIEQGKAYDYPFSYSRSRRLRRERIRLQRAEFERQQELKLQTEEFIRRNIVGQKTKQAQARRKQLEKTAWLEPPLFDEPPLALRIPEANRGGALTLSLKGGRIGFQNEMGAKVLAEEVELTARRGERIAILGGNGSGKTTLLRTLMGEHPLLEGELEWGVNNLPRFFTQESRFDDPDQTVFDVLVAINGSLNDEEIRSYAARFLFRGDDVFKRVGHLSGGERTRLALARLFSRSANVLFLDEPTNHLDIQSRESLEAALKDFGGTLILTSHDLYFVGEVTDRYFLIEGGKWGELDRVDEVRERLRSEPGKDRDRGEASKPAPRLEEAAAAVGLSKNERMRLTRRIEEVESEIESLEKQRADIETALQERGADHLHLLELARVHERLEKDLKALYRKWEELGRRLENS